MKFNYNAIFLVALVIIAGVGVYLILKSFLLAVLLGFLISRPFTGWHKWILKKTKNKEILSALVACSLVFLFFVIPISFFIGLVILQATQFYQALDPQEIQQKFAFLTKITEIPLIKNFMGDIHYQELLKSNELASGIKSVGNFILQVLKSTYQGTANFIFMAFIMFFSLYYFFKDGDRFIKQLADLSPLKNQQVRKLVSRFLAISKATFKGSLVIAVIQGILVGLLFWVTGVSTPAFWALVTVFAAFIPAVGAGLIWAPAGIIMLVSGSIWQGIVIIVFGVLAISTIDNFLRPRLIGKDTSMHPLLVLLSTIGGLSVFGILGLLWGPIIVALFIALLEIYRDELGEKINGN